MHEGLARRRTFTFLLRVFPCYLFYFLPKAYIISFLKEKKWHKERNEEVTYGTERKICSRAELTPTWLITNQVCRIHDGKSKENRVHGWKEAFLECVWKWKMDGGMGVQGEWLTLPYWKWTVSETGDVSKQQEMFLCGKALKGKGKNGTWGKWKMGLKIKIF